MTKKCKWCGVDKPISEFYPRRKKGEVVGHSAQCKACEKARVVAYNAARYKEDPDFRLRKRLYDSKRHASRMEHDPKYRAEMRDRSLRMSYGITQADYDKMLRRQRGKCAICRYKPDPEDKRPRWRLLEVDHCHETGKVRGLLCRRCNDALGKFEDNPKLLKRALAFITA